MRIDQLLVERGLAASRSQAQRLIAGGVKWQQPDGGWRAVVKNRDEVPETAALQLLDDAESRYVSRGGLKLEGALKATGVLVDGLRCLDVGQSTGGFTDCLLQHGAAEVVGIDVGHAQVHPRISQDERVICIEGVNARELEPGDERVPEALEGFDLMVGDARIRPDADAGYAACEAARAQAPAEGCVGTGTGAVVGNGAALQDKHVIRMQRHGDFVQHADHGGAQVHQRLGDAQPVSLVWRVQVGQRLIHQQHLGLNRQRARQQDPLALATREL
jgi:hypothetical protein